MLTVVQSETRDGDENPALQLETFANLRECVTPREQSVKQGSLQSTVLDGHLDDRSAFCAFVLLADLQVIIAIPFFADIPQPSPQNVDRVLWCSLEAWGIPAYCSLVDHLTVQVLPCMK